MWVYKQNSLRNRIQLTPTVGGWLDYWLFLHSEEAHPVWSNRPLGLRQLAQAAPNSTSYHDSTLRLQLAREASDVVKLSPFLKGLATPPTSIPATKYRWNRAWLHWFDKLIKDKDVASIVEDLSAALLSALQAGNWRTVYFLTRRLAAEVIEDDWSHHERFIAVNTAMCESGAFSQRELAALPFVDTLRGCLSPPSVKQFTVTVPFAPTPITETIVRAFRSGPRLVLDRRADAADAPPLLTGIAVEVEAAHVGQAAAFALGAAREALDRLRLIHYVRTHLSGSVAARAGSDASIFLSLPQPFWSKASGRRKVPRLPKRFNSIVAQLPRDESSRWNAAHWHLSRALADWAEDSHTASAHIWQALEAFAPPVRPPHGVPTALAKVSALVPDYLRWAIPEMGDHLGSRVSLQARELATVGVTCDWYRFDSTRVSLRTWLARVLGVGSRNRHTTWSSPPAPVILFDESVGLLQAVDRRLRSVTAEPWMERRLQADLALLYGIRNKAVHHGERVLSRRTARYLGQLGAELLLGVMAARVPQPAEAKPEA